MRFGLFDDDARAAVDLAVEIARRHGHEKTISIHLLLALASDPKTRSAELLADAGVAAGAVGAELERLVPTGPPLDHDPPLGVDLSRILDLASRETTRLTEVRTRPEHLLLALLAPAEGGRSVLGSMARGDLRWTIVNERGSALGKPGLGDRLTNRSTRSTVYTETLSDYTIDLADRPAHAVAPVARDAEIERAAQILARRNRRSPILVARPGVGTGSIITGLALLAQDTLKRPTVPGMVRALNWEAVGRSRDPGIVEKVVRTAARLRELILCVDNAAERLDLGPGPGTAGEWLWPLLADTGLRVVLAMTPGELDALNARGSRLETHCQAMTVAEPDVERAVAMVTAGLDGLEAQYRLRITQEAAATAVTLADRYVTDALLPLKALHILTEACAARSESAQDVVDVEAVTEAVANWTGLPAGEITVPVPEAPAAPAARRAEAASRLPLPAQSTAVLIGTAVHDSPEIPDIRSITGNLTDLRAVLAHDRSGGFAPTRTHVFADADESLRPKVAELAAEARDTLLLYFGGHGWVEADGRLYLGLRTTQPTLRRYTSLPYEDLRAMVIDSPARRKLVILDCCFSGRAVDMLGDTGDTAGHLDISGTYVLTATPATRMAHAPDGKRNSAFTESLLDVLRDGIEHAGELLRVADVFPQVRARLAARGLPEPQQRGTNTIGELALARNPRHRA